MPVPFDPVTTLREALAGAAAELRGAPVDLPGLERPPKPEFGDYSSNAAMLLAPLVSSTPREVAAGLAELLSVALGDQLDRVEVAGPGFLNLHVSDSWVRSALAGLVTAGDAFGASGEASPEAILVEFVSANPTGPITVASGRHAAYGDSLCRVLALAGHTVEREYYVNDHGSQVRRFGESLLARARGEDPPEAGYQGGYVADLAARIEGAAEMDVDELARRGVELVLEGVRASLDRFRVRFDRYASERDLHERGAVEAVRASLEEAGRVYESEGARWLRTTEFGDDKDRVLRRGTGEMTYFAADIAYHEDKRRRGHERVIDVWGADHHGYIARVRAAWQALGESEDSFEIVLMQLVNLTDGGERVQMSKRAGDIVTLDDLIEDIGVDAARWFLLQRSHDTTLDLDLELAREQSQENPVYYVQYAHARIASILSRLGDERVETALGADLAGSPESPHPSARVLVKTLLEFPDEVTTAAARRAPHRIAAYGLATAQAFSAFYRDCKVVGAAEEGGDEDLRIAICVAVRQTLARSLDLVGVEAPEEM